VRRVTALPHITHILRVAKITILVIDLYDLHWFTDMSLEDALKRSNDGIIIDFEVTPGSKAICIPSGYNEWRKRIEVKLSQPAQKGKANEQLIYGLSKLFGVSTSNITITNGAKSSKKSIMIKGIGYDDVVNVLNSSLDG